MSDETFVYPTDQVVGAVPAGHDTDELRSALAAAGVPEDAITVHSRSDGQDLAPRTGDADGAKQTVVRAAQKVLGDESERMQVLEDRLAEGATLVCVRLAADDDDAREQEKRDLGAVLRRHGAEDVAFYGKYQIEQLDTSAT
ncbi:MAG: hypothetical protein WEB09_11595 [Nitriliruptor sp.]